MNPTLTLIMISVRQISSYNTLIVFNLHTLNYARHAIADCQK